MARYVDRPVRQAVQQGHVLGRLVGASAVGGVVGGADADQNGADALVGQVELDLLERSLDQERCVRVGDGPHAGPGQARGDADHELLANADVNDPIGMTVLGPHKAGPADVGQHHRQPRILVEEVAGNPGEAVAHGLGGGGGASHDPGSTTATTTLG